MNTVGSTEASVRLEPQQVVAPPTGTHVGPGEGRLLRALASQLEIKAGEDAGLRFGIFRSTFPPGAGMPFLHVHRSADEAFCILRGEAQFVLGAQEIRARAGSVVLIPAGVPHCFRNVGTDDVEQIVVSSDARLVAAVEALARVAPGDIDAVTELHERSDSELLERHPHWGLPPTAPSPG